MLAVDRGNELADDEDEEKYVASNEKPGAPQGPRAPGRSPCNGAATDSKNRACAHPKKFPEKGRHCLLRMLTQWMCSKM